MKIQKEPFDLEFLSLFTSFDIYRIRNLYILSIQWGGKLSSLITLTLFSFVSLPPTEMSTLYLSLLSSKRVTSIWFYDFLMDFDSCRLYSTSITSFEVTTRYYSVWRCHHRPYNQMRKYRRSDLYSLSQEYVWIPSLWSDMDPLIVKRCPNLPFYSLALVYWSVIT